MELIKKEFNKYFSNWNIKLPEEDLDKRCRGFIQDSGWLIQYCFGKERELEYLDFYAAHRMTDDRHHRIYENGEIKDLPSLDSFYLADSEEPELTNSEVAQMLIDKGFDKFTLNMCLKSGFVD